MSFLESIQHGLEKASQEAARITKIQHLRNISDDLTFKASQQGQQLIASAMELYSRRALNQGELTAICQQIATYQQQNSEVQAELQRLQHPDESAGQEAAPIAPPPAGYPAYPAPPPTGYPPYPAPQANYPAYPGAPTAPDYSTYATYPVSPSGEPPTRPGAASQTAQSEQPPPAVSGEPPTQPGARSRKATADTQSTPPPAEVATDIEPKSVAAPGSYEDGVLPPIYSPFSSHPAPTGNPAEPDKPGKSQHSAKKSKAEENSAAPAQEKKAHKTPEKQS